MNEQFESSKLKEINENLEQVNKNLGSLWLSFAKGSLYGLGSVIGAGLAIILIGWFLNIIGVIPALKKTSEQWRTAIQQVQDAKYAPADNTNTTPAQ